VPSPIGFVFYGPRADVTHIKPNLLKAALSAYWQQNTKDQKSLTRELELAVKDAICLAAKVNCVPTIEYFTSIDNKLAKSSSYPGGSNPIYWAIKSNSKNAVEALLAAGAGIDELDHDNERPLRLAVNWHRYEIARYLISLGANINAVFPPGVDGIIKCARLDKDDEMLKILGVKIDDEVNDDNMNDHVETLHPPAPPKLTAEMLAMLGFRPAATFAQKQQLSASTSSAGDGKAPASQPNYYSVTSNTLDLPMDTQEELAKLQEEFKMVNQ
jgi:hypothetical protein